jgi:hypothetical protein
MLQIDIDKMYFVCLALAILCWGMVALVRAVRSFQAASETRHYEVTAIRMRLDDLSKTLAGIEETQSRIREDINQIKNSAPLNPRPFG